ncbi:MAG: Tol-Pal system beta propeller repeat protein TolB [Thermodesulfobacteriota bacterium]
MRYLLSTWFTILLTVALPSPGASRIYIDINAPAGKTLPLAIQEIKIVDNAPSVAYLGKEVGDVLAGDLNFSGLFELIDRDAYIEDINETGLTAAATDFREWRIIGSQLLIKGGIRFEGEKVTIDLRLFDVVREKVLVGKRYIGTAENMRGVAHRFADKVIDRLTGERGIFSTKLLFTSDGSGSKEVYIAHFNGDNIQQITRNGAINLSPQWSPDGSRMIYTSYKEGQPYIYLRDLSSGFEWKLLDKPGINISGRWSPDGSKVAATLSINGNPELYIIDVKTRRLTRVTKSYGIDVSPSWSPDGKRLVFVSDRAGNPHIYMIKSDGSGVKRMTYEGKYNTTPAWSPRGDQIAFARLVDGNFHIFLIRPDGRGITRLTSSGDNETPSWSPDGRYIAYSSLSKGGEEEQRALYIMRSDGTHNRRVVSGIGNSSAPSWSPYLP